MNTRCLSICSSCIWHMPKAIIYCFLIVLDGWILLTLTLQSVIAIFCTVFLYEQDVISVIFGHFYSGFSVWARCDHCDCWSVLLRFPLPAAGWHDQVWRSRSAVGVVQQKRFSILPLPSLYPCWWSGTEPASSWHCHYLWLRLESSPGAACLAQVNNSVLYFWLLWMDVRLKDGSTNRNAKAWHKKATLELYCCY